MKGLGVKQAMEGSMARQLRRFLLICIAGSIFLVLHKAFGSTPSQSSVATERFPKKIWQSWQVDPLRFEQRDNERARTWIIKNPGHRYEVLTDDNALTYVEEHFGPTGFNRPDIVYIYRSLNARIIQADLLRYLVMYVEGGLYTDIDVEAIRSIDRFIPNRFEERDIDMVIGVETDEPDFKSHPILGQKSQSFCQWTFMCKPGLPVMMRLIDNILQWLDDLSQKQNKPISDLHLDFDEVLSGTGPSAFTSAILAEMSAISGEATTWDNFHALAESKVVGRILVLTVEAFVAGTGHSDSGNHGGKRALVKHHFHASKWTTNHPRYKHPIYDEVEKCNWNMECVKLWDMNVAIFDALPKQDQLKMIAIKEVVDDEGKNAGQLLAENLLGIDLPPAGSPGSELPVEAPPVDDTAPADIPEAPYKEAPESFPADTHEGLPVNAPPP